MDAKDIRYVNDKLLDELLEEFNNGKYKEDFAKYMEVLYKAFTIVIKTDYGRTFASTINALSKNRTSTIVYSFYKDLFKILESADESIDFSKYLYIIDEERDYSTGNYHDELKTDVIRNANTEFAILMKRIDISGMITILRILSTIKRY